MTSFTHLSVVGAATLLAFAAVSVVMAQTGTGGASPMYDVKTETTIKGTVRASTRSPAQAAEATILLRDASHGEDREGGARSARGPTAYLLRKGSRCQR